MKIGVVLGSGGHTSEMIRNIKALDRRLWTNNRVFYVVSHSDTHSKALADDLEKSYGRSATCYIIPRAREVGQSYFTSIFSTLRGVQHCLHIVTEERPDILLLNGPGVCMPVVLAAVVVATCFPRRYSRPYIAYLESFTCISHLSLTGTLLVPYLADLFTVHWRALEVVARSRQRRGVVRYIGCEGNADSKSNLMQFRAAQGQRSTSNYAVVTVGSTHFDELAGAVLQECVLACLKVKFHVSKLYLQYGTMSVDLLRQSEVNWSVPDTSVAESSLTGCLAGVQLEAFRYRPHLNQLLAGASLVVTHAGAGTILECLSSHGCVVVVPNRRLMSDHQSELAFRLASEHYLFCLEVQYLAGELPHLDFRKLLCFPGFDEKALMSSLKPCLSGIANDSNKKTR